MQNTYRKKKHIFIAASLALVFALCLSTSFNKSPSQRRELAVNRFNQARREGNQVVAEKLYKELLDVSKEGLKLSPNSEHFYKTLEEADALSSSGNLAGARAKYLAACVQGQKMHDDNEFEASAMNSYALALENYGKYGEAENLLKQAVQLRIKVSSKDYVDRFLANNLGNIYLLKGEYEKAAKEFEETIALDKIIQGENYFGSSVVNKLTTVYIKLKRCSELEPYFRPILLHETDLVREDPIALAAFKTSLGNANASQGNYCLAQSYYESALKILQENNFKPFSVVSKSLDDMLSAPPLIMDIQKSLWNTKQNAKHERR